MTPTTAQNNRDVRLVVPTTNAQSHYGGVQIRPSAKYPMTLTDLAIESAAWDAEFSEIRLNRDDLRFRPDGVEYAGQVIPMNQDNRTRQFIKIGAPGRYLEEKHSTEFQAAALTEHLALGDFGQKPTLVLRDGELTTIVRGELCRLPNAAIVRSVADEWRKKAQG